MLSGYGKHGIIISKTQIMQLGLKEIVKEYLPGYDFSFSCSQEALTLLQLRRATLVIADLSGETGKLYSIYQACYCLMEQYKDIHWIYLIDGSCDTQAKDLLTCANSILLSVNEPAMKLGTAIRTRFSPAESVSQISKIENIRGNERVLTLPERKVLRLLAKGWSINQIASLLLKSNKTISAQKIVLCAVYPYAVMQKCMPG